jgi:hypothetical protein
MVITRTCTTKGRLQTCALSKEPLDWIPDTRSFKGVSGVSKALGTDRQLLQMQMQICVGRAENFNGAVVHRRSSSFLELLAVA